MKEDCFYLAPINFRTYKPKLTWIEVGHQKAHTRSKDSIEIHAITRETF